MFLMPLDNFTASAGTASARLNAIIFLLMSLMIQEAGTVTAEEGGESAE